MRYRYLFIANPGAGPRDVDLEPVIGQVLGSSGAWDLRYTQHPGEAVDFARAAREEGYDRVVAAGGDGTVNEVAQGLLDCPLPLGVLPLGSGNAFARSMGVPRTLPQALTWLLSSSSRPIDVGTIDDHVFLSTAGLGIDAEVCRRFNSHGHRRGLWPYIHHSLKAVTACRPLPVDVAVNGQDARTRLAYLVAIANTPQYGYGATIAPDARPDDGQLDVCIVEDLTFWRAIVHTRRLFSGSIGQMPGVTLLKVTQMTLQCHIAPHLQIDGESVEGTIEMRVGVRPGALEVLAA